MILSYNANSRESHYGLAESSPRNHPRDASTGDALFPWAVLLVVDLEK